MSIPELLAPAGNFEKLVTAIHYGADAVYLGGKQYSLRAQAANFSAAELRQAVSYAHDRAVKVYVTVNIIAHDRDFQDLDDYLLYLREIEVDGLIVSDPGIMRTAGRLIPEMPIHLSTQANVTNRESARFWQEQGVKRLNVARELDVAAIAAIREAVAAEVEVFVHGALCISYSGRCLLSYYLTGRDANQGNCAQPCRYRYVLLEEKRPRQYFPIEEDERGTYIFNAKDLCLINKLPALLAAGVDSLKIEGRMKSTYYVGAVVRVYRAALDYLAGASPAHRQELPPRFRAELAGIGTRGQTENFIDGPPTAGDIIYETPRLVQSYAPVGVVRLRLAAGPADFQMEVRNVIKEGDAVEYLDKGLGILPFTIAAIYSLTGERLAQANPGNVVAIATRPPAIGTLEPNGLIRKKIASYPMKLS